MKIHERMAHLTAILNLESIPFKDNDNGIVILLQGSKVWEKVPLRNDGSSSAGCIYH